MPRSFYTNVTINNADANAIRFDPREATEHRRGAARSGWIAADRSAKRACGRLDAAYPAAMEAPVTGPADLLAKLQVRGKESWKADFEEVDAGGGGEEEQLFVAIYRDLEAMAERAVA